MPPISDKIINDKLEAWWTQDYPEPILLRVAEPEVSGTRLRIQSPEIWVWDPRHIKVLDESGQELQGLGRCLRIYASDNSTLISEALVNPSPPSYDQEGGYSWSNPGTTEFSTDVFLEFEGSAATYLPANPSPPPDYLPILVLCARKVNRKLSAKAEALRYVDLFSSAQARLQEAIADLKGFSPWDADIGPTVQVPDDPNDVYTLAGLGVRADSVENMLGIDQQGADDLGSFAQNPDPSTWPIPDPPADQRIPGHHSRHRAGKYTGWPGSGGTERHQETLPGGLTHDPGSFGFDPFLHGDQHSFSGGAAPADPLFINDLPGRLADNWAHGLLRDESFSDVADPSALHHLTTPSVLGAGGTAGFMSPVDLEGLRGIIGGTTTELAFNLRREPTLASADPEDGISPRWVVVDTAALTGAVLQLDSTASPNRRWKVKLANVIALTSGYYQVNSWYTFYLQERSSLSDALLDATKIRYGGGGTWVDTTTNPEATVEAQLDKIIADLTATAGAARLGGAAYSPTSVPNTLAAGSIQSQLNAIIDKINLLNTKRLIAGDDLLDTEANALLGRFTTARVSTATGERTLLQYHSAGGGNAAIRIYHRADVAEEIEIVVNAAWDGTQWVPDDSGIGSVRHRLGVQATGVTTIGTIEFVGAGVGSFAESAWVTHTLLDFDTANEAAIHRMVAGFFRVSGSTSNVIVNPPKDSAILAANQLFAKTFPKSWGYVSSLGDTLGGISEGEAHNVDSFVLNSLLAASFRVNFQVNMATNNYSVVISQVYQAGGSAKPYTHWVRNQSTSGFNVQFYDGATVVDPDSEPIGLSFHVKAEQ